MNVNILNVAKQIALYGRISFEISHYAAIFYLLDVVNPPETSGKVSQQYIDIDSLNAVLKTHDVPEWDELKDYTIEDVISDEI